VAIQGERHQKVFVITTLLVIVVIQKTLEVEGVGASGSSYHSQRQAIVKCPLVSPAELVRTSYQRSSNSSSVFFG